MIAAALNLNVSRLDADSSSTSTVPTKTTTAPRSRQAQAPAVPDSTDDFDELEAMVHVGDLPRKDRLTRRGRA